MARLDTITVDGREVMQSVRLELKLPRAFGVRMRLAALCARAAGWLAGTQMHVVVDGEAEEAQPDERAA